MRRLRHHIEAIKGGSVAQYWQSNTIWTNQTCWEGHELKAYNDRIDLSSCHPWLLKTAVGTTLGIPSP